MCNQRENYTVQAAVMAEGSESVGRAMKEGINREIYGVDKRMGRGVERKSVPEPEDDASETASRRLGASVP